MTDEKNREWVDEVQYGFNVAVQTYTDSVDMIDNVVMVKMARWIMAFFGICLCSSCIIGI